MQAGRRRQQGATFLGILIIGGILAVGVYAGIRLVPIYVEYFAVQRALSQVATSGSTSKAEISDLLERRWEVEDIKSIDVKDVEITPTAAGLQVRAHYRAEAPFVANVSLVVDFDKSVIVGGRGDGT